MLKKYLRTGLDKVEKVWDLDENQLVLLVSTVMVLIVSLAKVIYSISVNGAVNVCQEATIL